jgi:serine/threonine-protein kinase
MSRCPACSRSVSEQDRYCAGCGTALGEQDEASSSTVAADSSMLTGDETPDSIDHGSFLPGTIIAERYRIVGLLGKGGMGEVYRADDLKLGQAAALKFLPVELADDPRRRERFHNEVRVARQVAHPNLCRVYDIGEVEGHTYLSMEYVDGEDLSSLLRRIGRVPRAKAIEIAMQLCAGLAASHERGILHHDLKPANVMIDGRGKVRITDFGLAALADDLIGPAARAGTPPYMAPEQVTGREFTVRSEVYTLGLVLYELFTGKRAFSADSAEEYARLHTSVTPTKPSQIMGSVDPAVERVILQCLEKDPRLRPASPMEVAAALPGGDPLAAALAAGETPSPELVAATAPAEAIPPNVGIACLIVILIGIVAFPFLNDHVKLHAFVPLEKPPEVLVDRAREIISKLGYDERARDWAYGFDVDEQYLNHIEGLDQSSARWARLALGRPTAMGFWYRQGPKELIPTSVSGTVTASDPPPLVPEMIGLRVDQRGRLLSFRAIPASPTSTVAVEPDWAQLFEEAGLDIRRFRHSIPTSVPPVFCDRRSAWTGVIPENPDAKIRIEAAALDGRPVYFETRLAGQRREGDGGLTAPEAGQLINMILLLISLAGAAWLARRNLALGRGDRRGARRVAILVGGALMLAWALKANHVANAIEELRLLGTAAGRSLVVAGICWLLYIALEPYVRQRRPEILISWNRLLAGRVRDPAIGRDILIGGLFGIVGVLLTAVLYFAPGLFGAPPPRPVAVSNLSFLGLRYELAQLLQVVTTAVLIPMAVLLLLLLLLVVMRSRRLGLVALFVLLSGVSTLITLQPGGNVYVNAAVYGMLTAALIFVLVRFGLLAVMMAGFYILLLERFPITANLGAWYVGGSYFALLIAGGLALYGFSTSLAGSRRRRAPLMD